MKMYRNAQGVELRARDGVCLSMSVKGVRQSDWYNKKGQFEFKGGILNKVGGFVEETIPEGGTLKIVAL